MPMLLAPLSVSAILLSVSSISWVPVWVSMELLVLVVVYLAPSLGGSETEATIKYFLIQVGSSGVVLQSMLSSSPVIWLFLAGLIVKLGLTPAHVWVIHTYSGFSWGLIGVCSTFMKIPSLCIAHASSVTMPTVAVLTGLLGCVGGVYVSGMKKLVAYSSVANTGWVVLLLSASDTWALYFLAYSITTLGLTFALLELGVTSTRQLMNRQGLVTNVPIVLMLLSMAGVPPLLGFGPKWLLLWSLGSQGSVQLLVALLVPLSVYYYLQVCVLITLTSTPRNPKVPMSYPTLLVCTMTVFIGVVLLALS